MRVNAQTDPESLKKFITEYWELEMPNLLISVTGGAKNFDMKPRLKEAFYRGLMKAADSTSMFVLKL